MLPLLTSNHCITSSLILRIQRIRVIPGNLPESSSPPPTQAQSGSHNHHATVEQYPQTGRPDTPTREKLTSNTMHRAFAVS